jgi:hypothetical protein
LVFLSGCKGTTNFWFHQIFRQLFFIFLQKNAFLGVISGKIGKKQRGKAEKDNKKGLPP